MAVHGGFHPFPALQVLIVLFVLAALVADHVQGRHDPHDCPPFSCGNLGDVSPPFRRRGDPLWCGSQSYELDCSGSKAIIRVDDGTYYVTHISQQDRFFWVIDADLVNSSCPLPRWKQLPWEYKIPLDSHQTCEFELVPDFRARFATFVKCSQKINNNGMYRPVACLSTTRSFVYVLSSVYTESLEPSCGYLAMVPLGGRENRVPLNTNLSYADVVKFMRKGFAIQFPLRYSKLENMNECLVAAVRNKMVLGLSDDEPVTHIGIKDWIVNILMLDSNLFECAVNAVPVPFAVLLGLLYYALWPVKLIAVPCRFVLAPLSVFTFLAHKYWRTKITIDAVEKFLRMQQMLCPMRYAYTDITAITSHFREKLGQGGYGSVYKGVLLPRDLHVAVKMLGNSNCNGEEFISEVATIGRIHHVNVVRLVGFCSEEMRRALIYEYMPRGSLDKYIFTSEMGFSWEKLNEIALGIARGIDYLHQGCAMQILHFDIKPHNILLDGNFVPKVADFGLAKLYPRDNSFVPMSAMRGTIGYIAPEMVSRGFGAISSKSDVYSFGMVLLEMAGGRRNADPNAANSSQAYYPSWIYSRLTTRSGEVSESVDMHDLEKKLCIVGLWCIQMRPHDRPTMGEVIEMLEDGVDNLEMPPRPFFCDGDDEQTPAADSNCLSSELNTIEEDE